MKTSTFLIILSFLFCFPSFGFAKNELVMRKEFLYWTNSGKTGAFSCYWMIRIDEGQDVPDMRKEPCGNNDGKFSFTLSGPPGTTVTFFGKYNFEKGNGYLTIKKKDDRMIWLLDMISFPAGQWHFSEATDDSGAFEAFYQASPIFEQSVSSIKWGNNDP